jgi:hypothetical protein
MVAKKAAVTIAISVFIPILLGELPVRIDNHLRGQGSWQAALFRQLRIGDHEMSILTPIENSFLDVYLHEATTSPFTGPATVALHNIGVEYGDLLNIAWAYEHDVSRSGIEWGHAPGDAPSLPWETREAVLQRNAEIQCIREQVQHPVS